MIHKIFNQLLFLQNSKLNKEASIFFYFCSFGLIALVLGFFMLNSNLWITIFPAILLVYLFLILTLEQLFFITIFFTPLSVALKDFISGLPFDISLPSEALLIILTLIFLFRWLNGLNLHKKFIQHPVTISILFYLIWLGISSISSELPLVSIKFLIAKIWFIVPSYFLGFLVFSSFQKMINALVLHIIALSSVIIYTLIRYKEMAWMGSNVPYYVMSPFYNDHTAYGAIIALFFPSVIALFFIRFQSKFFRIFSLLIISIFLLGLIFSFSRAAWISIVISFCILMIYLIKIKIRYIVFSSLLLITIGGFYFNEIIDSLSRNNQDSSTDLIHHVSSISNIATDPSNVERINRWSCAWRMFSDKPFLGWGPATYMFLYARFQKSENRTIISTNTGNWGNAHNEYLGPLAETGLIGFLSILWIFSAIFFTGNRLIRLTKVRNVRILAIALLTGFVGYYAHGVLNNFLDTEKLAVPFWFFAAILVTLDINRLQNNIPDINEL